MKLTFRIIRLVFLCQCRLLRCKHLMQYDTADLKLIFPPRCTIGMKRINGGVVHATFFHMHADKTGSDFKTLNAHQSARADARFELGGR